MKYIIGVLLFFICLFLGDINKSIKSQQLIIEVSPNITRLDSVDVVLTNKLLEQEIYYSKKIDSLSKVTKNLRYDVNKIRNSSIMMP